MSDVATNRQELIERLTGKFLAARSAGDGSSGMHNPQADVTVMMGYMMEHIAAALRGDAWPEVTDYLAAIDGTDKNVFIEEHCREMHLLVGEFLKAAFHPTEEQREHLTFIETLESLSWRTQPKGARVAYMYMLGLFHLSRCWVIGRQSHELGLQPAMSFQEIATAAGIELRLYDQGVDGRTEGLSVLREATRYASQLGVGMEDIQRTVVATLSDHQAIQSPADLSVLGRLWRRIGGYFAR